MIKKIILLTAFLSTLFMPILTMSQSNALFEGAKGQACQGVTLGAGTCDSKSATTLNNILKTVLNLLTVIVGIIAVIMIIIGGLKFITSNGDASSVASAKSTIIFAVVGLIIVAFAQIIVKFVLRKSGQ